MARKSLPLASGVLMMMFRAAAIVDAGKIPTHDLAGRAAVHTGQVRGTEQVLFIGAVQIKRTGALGVIERLRGANTAVAVRMSHFAIAPAGNFVRGIHQDGFDHAGIQGIGRQIAGASGIHHQRDRASDRWGREARPRRATGIVIPSPAGRISAAQGGGVATGLPPYKPASGPCPVRQCRPARALR